MSERPSFRPPHILLAAFATFFVLVVAEKVLYFHSPLLGWGLAFAGPLALAVLLFKSWHTERRTVVATYLMIAVIGALLFAWKWGADTNRDVWDGSPFAANPATQASWNR